MDNEAAEIARRLNALERELSATRFRALIQRARADAGLQAILEEGRALVGHPGYSHLAVSDWLDEVEAQFQRRGL